MRLLFLALVLTLVAVVGEPGKAQMPPLERAQIEGFLAALPELRALGGPNDTAAGADPAAPLAPLITSMAFNGALDRATAIAAKRGFKNLADWAEVGNRAMRAYAYRNAGADLGAATETIAAAVARIRDDPDLTPEQQDIMLRQLELATGAILRFQPPPRDIAAIDPYMAQLQRLFQ